MTSRRLGGMTLSAAENQCAITRSLVQNGPVSEERILTAGLIVDGAWPAEPAISPDGRWVTWTVSAKGDREQQVSGLWLAPAGAASAPVRLTGSGARIRLPRWSSDSSCLFYVDDEGIRRQQVTDGGPAEETVLSWRGEVSGLAPLARGLLAVVAADEPSEDDERRRAEQDDAMVWSERAVRQHWLWHRLRLLDLASGKLTVIAGLADRHVVGIAQRPDGGPLAVLSWDCPEFEPGAFTARLHIVHLDDGTVTDLGEAGLDAHSPAWWQAADGWHVAWLAAVPPAEATAVLDVRVPAGGTSQDGTGQGTPADLTRGLTACPEELVQVSGGPPVALFAEGLDTALYRLDPAAGPDPAAGRNRAGQVFRRVVRWPGRAERLSISDDGSVIAVLVSTATTPFDVQAGPPDGLTRISDTRPELRGITLGAQHRLSWLAPDELEIGGVLVLPPGKDRADGPFPLIANIHGGPYGRWADEFLGVSWWAFGQWLATAGFAVLHPNPRGSQGRGQAFAAAVAGAVGQEEWTDILAGIDALVADGTADPGRLGIVGWSHGGFMAAWAVTQTNRFRAAVMGAGVVDWAIQVGAGDFGRAEAVQGGSFGWEGPGPHRHDLLSPVSYAANVTTPVLIVHGEADSNVPVGQATYFHRALSQFGAEHELVVYPRENHEFAERAHQVDVMDRIRSWFIRWLNTEDHEGQPGLGEPPRVSA